MTKRLTKHDPFLIPIWPTSTKCLFWVWSEVSSKREKAVLGLLEFLYLSTLLLCRSILWPCHPSTESQNFPDRPLPECVLAGQTPPYNFINGIALIKKLLINPQTTGRGPMDPDTSLTSAQEVIIGISKPMFHLILHNTERICCIDHRLILAPGYTYSLKAITLRSKTSGVQWTPLYRYGHGHIKWVVVCMPG